MSRSREPLRPVYGIWGEDRAKIDRALHRLVARVAEEGGMPPERFDAPATPAAEVAASCASLSFGGTRLIIVRDSDAWRADDVKPLLDYLQSPSPDTCLALVAAAAPTPKLVAAVAAAGQVLEFGPGAHMKRAERTRWFVDHLVAEVRRLGGSISAPVAREVVGRVGEDAGALTQEAAKLAAYAGDEPVSKEAVQLLVVPNPEARSFQIGDAIVAREAARAYELLADLATGDHPAEPIVVQMTLARHFRGVAAAQALGPGAPQRDVENLTGLRGFPAQKAVDHARALPPGAGERAVIRLAALELDLRVSALAQLGGSADDGRRLVLEQAVRDLLALTRAS